MSKTGGTEVTTYEYDIAERMSAVKRDGVTLGSYQYDPFGRRVKKVTSAGAVYFHYDDTGLLAEYDASGQLISEYQYQPGNHWMTHPLFKRDGATGKVHYYYNSHLGQPLKLFDKAGRTTWSARSQAFGQTDVMVNETANPLRFPGQYEDGETGLYYNYHRYYDAEEGRYLRKDPLGLAGGGPNTYAYTGGNPVGYVDPDGRIPLPVITGAIGAIAGFGGNIIGQLASNGGKFSCINWKSAGIAGVVGAAAGAMAPFVATTLARASGLGVVSNVLQYGVTQYANGDPMSLAGFAWSAVTGAVGGFVGGKINTPNYVWDTSGQWIRSSLARALNQDAQAAANAGYGSFLRNLGGATTASIDLPDGGEPGGDSPAGSKCGCD